MKKPNVILESSKWVDFFQINYVLNEAKKSQDFAST